MSSLRNRIAALLIVAIVSVVGLATLAANHTLKPPSPEATIGPVARNLRYFVHIVEQDPSIFDNEGLKVEASPAGGTPDEMLTHFLQTALARTGVYAETLVTRRSEDLAPLASVRLSNGRWLVMEIPGIGPPRDGGRLLAVWIGFIVLGSAVVSIFAATKITRPLQLLESAVGRIGPDGAMQHIPETGSGEVKATARALNLLSERLKAAMESRMRLVAAAGHDLRTPMTRMRLRAEFIEDETERQKWLADLEELDAIADSAIRLVREEVSTDPIAAVDLDQTVREILRELGDLGHGAALDYPRAKSPLFVLAAPLALKRALRNLVVNAVTHGKRARLGLETRDGDVILTIADEGPGIPEELLGRVFEPFFRVDPGRRKLVAGAGLGLAIAREIVERFHGRIAVANRQPNGLLQTVSFPLCGAA